MKKIPQIIAVDFDGTLCANAYPDIGAPIESVIKYIKQRKAAGDAIILWTCRSGIRLAEAIAWCTLRGLKFDRVNENTRENINTYGKNTRKVFADIYIDDKAVHPCDLDDVDFDPAITARPSFAFQSGIKPTGKSKAFDAVYAIVGVDLAADDTKDKGGGL